MVVAVLHAVLFPRKQTTILFSLATAVNDDVTKEDNDHTRIAAETKSTSALAGRQAGRLVRIILGFWWEIYHLKSPPKSKSAGNVAGPCGTRKAVDEAQKKNYPITVFH